MSKGYDNNNIQDDLEMYLGQKDRQLNNDCGNYASSVKRVL
jgi:hypothetical protein